MFRLQVKRGRSWVWGRVVYDSLEAAAQRVQELSSVGIKARIKQNAELFN